MGREDISAACKAKSHQHAIRSWCIGKLKIASQSDGQMLERKSRSWLATV